MQISSINSITTALDKFRSALNSYTFYDLAPQDEPIVQELKTKVQEIEDLLLELKDRNDSAAAKVARWLQAHRGCLPPHSSWSGNESKLQLFIPSDAFGFNTKIRPQSTEKEDSESAEAWYHTVQNYRGYYHPPLAAKLTDLRCAFSFNQMSSNSRGERGDNPASGGLILEFDFPRSLAKNPLKLDTQLNLLTEEVRYFCDFLRDEFRVVPRHR